MKPLNTTLFGSLLTITLILLTSSNCRAEDKRLVAFVAAVSEYDGNAAIYESIETAETLSTALDSFGFDVKTLYDFSKREFETEYNKWIEETASKAQVVLFYFVGHGGQLDGTGYMIPLGVDFEGMSSLESQAINYVKDVVAPITRSDEAGGKRQLRIALIDGFRKFPYRIPSKTDPGLMEKISGFAAPYYNAVDTVLIIPGTQPGEIITEEDSGLLVEAFIDSFLQDGATLTKSLEEMDSKFDDLTQPRRRGIWNANNFNGDYTFIKSNTGDKIVSNLLITREEIVTESEQEQIKKDARKAWRNDDLESAIKLLIKLYDDFPESSSYAKNQLRMLLVSSTILYDPHASKKLIESDKFDFKRLLEPEPSGFDLDEARSIYMEAGKVFFPAEASVYAERSAKAGNPRAMHVLALILHNMRRSEEAIKWFKQAADSAPDPSESLLYLGQLHLNGEGCVKSIPEAEQFFLRALDMKNQNVEGDPEAAIFLGHLEVEKQYANENVDERNFSKAVEWYELARKYREFKGNTNLGQLYSSGFAGIEFNPNKGVNIILEGARIGKDSRCMWYLSNLYRQNYFQQPEVTGLVDEETAKRFTLMAADFGYRDAVEYCEANSMEFKSSARSLFTTDEAYLNKQYRERQAALTEKINE